MGTLDKFHEWADRNKTHVKRHLVVTEKQIENLRSYVELFQKYPANSIEFKVEVEKLFSELDDILADMKETTQDLADDIGGFIDVLESLKYDMTNRKRKSEGSKSG